MLNLLSSAAIFFETIVWLFSYWFRLWSLRPVGFNLPRSMLTINPCIPYTHVCSFFIGIPRPDSEGIQALQALQIHPLHWWTLWRGWGLTDEVHMLRSIEIMLLIFQEQLTEKGGKRASLMQCNFSQGPSDLHLRDLDPRQLPKIWRHVTTHQIVSHVDNGRPSSSTISKSPVSARGGPHISIHAVWWQETINKQKQAAKDKSLYCNILPRHCFEVLYPKQETNQLRLIFAICRGPTQSNSLLYIHICQYSFYTSRIKYTYVHIQIISYLHTCTHILYCEAAAGCWSSSCTNGWSDAKEHMSLDTSWAKRVTQCCDHTPARPVSIHISHICFNMLRYVSTNDNKCIYSYIIIYIFVAVSWCT